MSQDNLSVELVDMGHLLLLFLALAAVSVSAQNSNCDFVQNIQAGVTYSITSPDYPYSYPLGITCRWIMNCPANYRCQLECPEINLPQSTSCNLDTFLISKSGDPLLTNAERHCGAKSLTALSTGTSMSLGLVTSRNSPGGRFSCAARAVPVTPDPTSCTCGLKMGNRIVNGQETGVNEYPMMAGIVDIDLLQIKCGGVIISNRYVITAAHCVKGRNTTNIAVVVGEHDVSTGSDTPATQGIQIQSIMSHPQYTDSNYDYDIALLYLRNDIVFSARVGPVCLPFSLANVDPTGATVTMLGWGTLYPGGPTSNVLRKVDVSVISQSSCRAQVPTLTARQMCTYTRGKDACQDDSGGPVLYTNPSNGLIYNLGIVSYGKFCASNSPGINTRVTEVLNWIVVNAPANYCRK